MTDFCDVFPLLTGARVWKQSKVQRGKVHHRAGSHDQGQRVGVTLRLSICFSSFCCCFSDLGMLFIELQGEGARPALSPPPSTSPHTFLTVKKINHLHLPASSTCTRTHLLIVKVNKRRPTSGATRWKMTSRESRRYFPRAFGIDPAHSRPAAAPPKHAYKWLWWRVDHYANEERDFTERTFLSFLDGWLWLF